MKIKSLAKIFLYLALGILFCYLLYKTWDIFGFWTLVWTGILSFLSTFISQLIGSRMVKDNTVVFNPKEWPKFINILLSGYIGYYLYTIINRPEISNYDFIFGLSYLILLTAVPVVIALYRLIRDRNDFISINDISVSYRDNKESATFQIDEISKAELVNKGINLTMKDSNKVVIKTNQMNFNAKDLIAVMAELNKRLPKESSSVEQIITDVQSVEEKIIVSD